MKNDFDSRLDKAEEEVRELTQACGIKTQTGGEPLDDDLATRAIDAVGGIDGTFSLLSLLLESAKDKDTVLEAAAIDGLRLTLEKGVEAIYDVIDALNQRLHVEGATSGGGRLVRTASGISSLRDSVREGIETLFNSGRILSFICRLLEAAAGQELTLDTAAADGLRLILEAAGNGMACASLDLEDLLNDEARIKEGTKVNLAVEGQSQDCALEGRKRA